MLLAFYHFIYGVHINDFWHFLTFTLTILYTVRHSSWQFFPLFDIFHDNSFHFQVFTLATHSTFFLSTWQLHIYTLRHSPWQFIHNCLLSIGNGKMQRSLKIIIARMICDSDWNRWKSNENVGQKVLGSMKRGIKS